MRNVRTLLNLFHAAEKKEVASKRRGNENWVLPFFFNAFIDGDKNDSIYALFGLEPEFFQLYQFDLQGGLKNIYRLAKDKVKSVAFFAKKNGGFYGISEKGVGFFKGVQ